MGDSGFDWPMRPEHWERLVPGTVATLVKRIDPGIDVVRYPAVVVETQAEPPWVEFEATWTAGTVVQGPLTFEPGDILREFFSWLHPYNAFSVFDPDFRHKGWYANVTYPSWVELDGDAPILIWHDLLLDVVADSVGASINLDDDELDDSELSATNPGLHAAIIAARDDILVNLRQRTGPFILPGFQATMPGR
jgi:hypothetical protein